MRRSTLSDSLPCCSAAAVLFGNLSHLRRLMTAILREPSVEPLPGVHAAPRVRRRDCFRFYSLLVPQPGVPLGAMF